MGENSAIDGVEKCLSALIHLHSAPLHELHEVELVRERSLLVRERWLLVRERWMLVRERWLLARER